ncbi:MAG: TonB-dependent receptor, partial [Prevotella sp.]
MRIFSILFFMAASLVPASAQEEDSCVHLTEITVTGLTGSTRISQHPAPVAVVGRDFLRSRMSSNIVDAIARRPGVSQITTGAAISKPVIRGLGYNRVLVVSGGVRQEGQQWGDEHGLEVDGQGVASVEILKGPASLMYGSDAMAGVLILHDEPRAAPGTMKADLTTEYQSNNGLFGCSADFAGNEGRVEWNWRYSAKFAHDYKNRNDGYVSGSRFREQALSGMLGTYGDWGSSRLRLTYYHLTPGIVEGERDEETGALLREDNGKHYSMLLPFQQVYHYKAVSDNSLTLGDGMLKIITAYQQNRRKEFEESRDECGLDFRLHTLNYDVRYVLPETGGWQANIGVGGMYQRSINEGEEFLIPSYNLFDIGAFVTVSKRLAQRWNISGGVRFDNRSLHSHPLSDDGELRFSTFSRTFSGISGSIGVVCNISEHLDAKLNVSSGFRAPNLSELGCNGVHEGTFRYETGDNRLKQEKSLQFDAGIDYASEPFSLELSLFANHIDNYIYLSRDGETYREELPVYRYAAGDARLFGGEIRLILHPFTHLHFENSFSY